MVKKNRTSIKDIARICGVAVSTVSHVLNKKSGVSEEKRLRVLSAIVYIDIKSKLSQIPHVVSDNYKLMIWTKQPRSYY